ncbi:MAG: UPF0149 family protein [Planctomycetes bacterium]|nr:UPF0149 family protein [Planctomycetota bacterium]MCB9905412.1 UPF0149 family protein [Planctomycetota bacterium]
MNTDLARKLSDAEFDELAGFLDRSPGSIVYAGVEGLLTAVASAPSTILPSVWHPVVFPEQVWDSVEQYQAIHVLLMRHYNTIVGGLMRGELFSWTDFDDDVEFSDWCTGYLAAVELDPKWLDDRESDAPSLDALRVVAGELPPLADAAEELEHLRKIVPSLALQVHEYWLERREGGAPTVRQPAVSMRFGRNDPCPCGSGKKFKRCCGS